MIGKKKENILEFQKTTYSFTSILLNYYSLCLFLLLLEDTTIFFIFISMVAQAREANT